MEPTKKMDRSSAEALGRTPPTRLILNIGESLFSMTFNLCGILAGSLLALYFGIFSVRPWALALFPGVLSVRGAIGGLFSGHLGTALHVGTVRATFTRNTREFYVLLHAIITLTFESSVMIGIWASLFGLFLWNATIVDCLSILSVSAATMGLSIVFISPITILVSVLSFKHGLDPDIVVYPVISTVDDVLVTICYIMILNSFFSANPLWQYTVWLIDSIFILIVLYFIMKNKGETVYRKTIREFFLTLISVAFIVNVTGATLGMIKENIGRKPEVYTVYPAIIDTVGDIGSIIGSTATTKLALGVIRPSFFSIKQHLCEIFGAWTASIILFTTYSMISSTLYGVTPLSNVLRFMAQILATNVLAASPMIFVSYAVAILTYRRGWDPDNFVIPIESSLADSVTTISLFIALNLIV